MTRLFAVAIGMLASMAVAQAVPDRISFNARLADSSGNPLSGTHAVSFALFNSATGGAASWTESYSAMPFTTSGLSYAELGSSTPLTPAILDGTKLFLEIAVDGTTMTPRVGIVSVPYAIRATEAARVGSLTPAQIQQRVSGTCNVGSAVRSINADGTVVCETVSGGGGGISAVNTATGSGLTGGGSTGALNIGLATCANGQVMMSNGSAWACSTAVGTAGPTGPPGAAGAAGPAGPSLYGSFDFEDALTSSTATDSSGSNNTLTLNTLGTAIIATGHSGKGILFDGISGFAANTAPTTPLTNAATISAWVYRTAAGGATQTIVAREGQFTLGIINGNASAAFQTALGPTWAYYSGAAVPLTTWTHIAATYDGLAIRIYVNGVVTANVPYANGPLAQPASTVPLRVGNRSYLPAGAEFLTGRVDEIRISPIAPSVPVRTLQRVQGYLSDNTDSGAVPGRSFTATKLTSNSGLRVMWSDNFRVFTNNSACRWEIYFNGAACTNPGGLYFDKYEGNTGSNRHDMATVMGTCFATAAGPLLGNVAITGRVMVNPSYTVADCATGWNSQLFSMDAEEVY